MHVASGLGEAGLRSEGSGKEKVVHMDDPAAEHAGKSGCERALAGRGIAVDREDDGIHSAKQVSDPADCGFRDTQVVFPKGKIVISVHTRMSIIHRAPDRKRGRRCGGFPALI